MRATSVEQVFVRPRAGRIEILVVLESPAGERRRDTLQAPTADALEAVRFAARSLARRGVTPARRTRLRRERGGELADDAALLAAFLGELRDAARATPEERAPWD